MSGESITVKDAARTAMTPIANQLYAASDERLLQRLLDMQQLHRVKCRQQLS